MCNTKEVVLLINSYVEEVRMSREDPCVHQEIVCSGKDCLDCKDEYYRCLAATLMRKCGVSDEP